MDENRMIQEENSVDSEDEARRHDYGLYLMKRLIQIKKAQINRVRLETLLRAFYRWSYEFPLAQKCDELAKQLRERNQMLDTVRSSYLRDVVSVKHHLDKINDAEVDDENPSLVKLKQNMYDLHTVPSVDLRSLVENARASVHQNSAQLREGLVDAGLLDPETLRTLNPWDQSRGYRRLMRIKKGGAAKPPDIAGESISLAAPSNKKLFVRYCRECIGLAVFIKDWNREVELSMKFKADFCNIDNLVQEYRSVIDKLNGTIEHQEKEIVRLLERTGKLETANAWFEKWGFMKEAGNTGKGGVMDEYEQKIMYKHISEMARAEIESFAFNSALRLEVKEQQHLSIELAHRQKLREAELSRDADSKERVKLVQEFRKTQQELQTRCNEIADLTQANAVKEAEKAHLNQKLVASEADNRHLHEVIDKKEADYASLRDESNTKIEDLNFQIKQLNDDYSNQENIIDELRDSLANKKATILDQTNEISELKQRVRELEALIPPPKPRFTLRVVAIAVRYLMRLHRLLRHKDFESMGRLGFNELTRRQDRYIKMLTNANEKLQRQVFALTQSLGLQGEELWSYRAVLRDKDVALREQDEVKAELKRTLSLLRHTERDKQEAIALGQSNIDAQNVIINQRVTVALDVQHDHHLRQAKVYAQIQRNLGHHLADSLFRVRAIVTSLDIDSDMPILAKPYEASLPPMAPIDTSPIKRKSPSGSYTAALSSDFSAKGGGSFHSLATAPPDILTEGRKNKKALMLNLRTRSRALVSWIKKNRKRMTLMPKKVPVTLFRQSRPEDDQEALRRERAKSLSVMTHVIQHDFAHAEEVRKAVDADMRKLQDYVLALKNKHNELLLQVKLLEEELREERMPSVNSRTSRKRIGDIKSSFSHLMHSTHPDHNSSYFSKVLEAIETVQAEHGELYKDKLIKSGKFKLTEVAMEVVNEVRRNSLSLSAKEAAPAVAVWSRQNSATKSAKLGGNGTSVKSVRLDPLAVALDTSPSRSTSFSAAGYPMTKLPSVAELDHEGESPARALGQGALPRPTSHSFRAAALSTKNGVNVPHAVPEVPEGPHHDEDGYSARSRLDQNGAGVQPLTGDDGSVNEAQPTRRRLFADETSADDTHAVSRSRPPKAVGGTVSKASAAQAGMVSALRLPDQDSDSDKLGFPSRDASSANLVSQSMDRTAETTTRPLAVTHPLVLSTPTAPADRVARQPRSSEDTAGDQPGFAPDTERSPRYDGGRPPSVDPPAPSYGARSGQEDTIGFEPVDGEDNISLSQDDELDDDILYMEDLLAAKVEMQGLLTREEVIQSRIKQAEEDREQLEQQVRSLEDKLEKKKQEYVQLEQNMYVSAGEQKQLKAEMKEMAHQNDLLKEIVEEDYRFHTAHVEKLLRDKEDEVLRRLQRKIETAHQSTQVSCAVCAIKEESLARSGAVPQVHGAYDDSTVAMVNEQFTKALHGEVVLVARPRRINKKSIRSNQAESPENVPRIAPHLRGFEELLANPPTKEELLKAAKPLLGGAFDAQLPPKGKQSRDRDPSPTLASSGMGFSELLMKHLDSNQQERTRPASAVAVADGTKFSRIKKMPAKTSTSSGDLLGGTAERTGPAQRPHSASLAALKRNSDQRTESHTAAFLQSRLMMTGHGSTPQVAPGYSQAHVPLHTVDLACNVPEPTAEYLARAALNRARASSASAARTEHTNSGKLLQGWQGMGEGGNYSGKGGVAGDSSLLGGAGIAGGPPRPQSVDVRVRVPLPSKRAPDSASPQPAAARREFSLDMADDLSDAGVEFV